MPLFLAYFFSGRTASLIRCGIVVASVLLCSAISFSQTGIVPADSLARLDSLQRLQQRFGKDSLGFPKTSLTDTGHSALSDTIKLDTSAHWVVYLDSTARMKEFVHARHDVPTVELFPTPKYALYLHTPAEIYKREVELDSSGQSVNVHERVNDVNVKVPLSVPLDDYIHQRYHEELKNNWRAMVHSYTMRQNRDELGGILGSFTNISIPVPANPLFDIFGGKTVNIRVSGGVDIQGAFRSQSSDQSTISSLDRSTTEPNFKQDVQVTVNGTIGDKLNILADWNTTRTFDYENQLKIKYTGYDDEIIQSVEAGNVSLQTPSLIGGGQALFGIKAKMQMGPLSLTTLVSQKKGQTKEFNVSGGAQSSTFQVYPQNYSTKHFFVDTLYRGYFDALHQTIIPVLTSQMQATQIVQMNVYISTTSLQQLVTGTTSNAKAYIDLGPVQGNSNTYMPSQLPQGGQETQTGRYEAGIFQRLTPGKDYTYDQYGGYINLIAGYDDLNQVIAVSYTVNGTNGATKTYGGLFSNEGSNTPTDTLILKLVKPKNILANPGLHPAWDLMLKNFYPLGITNVKKEGFKLDIYRRVSGSADVNNILGHSLLNVLGLDRYDANNQPNPDNQFDFIPGSTIDVSNGEIIFPTLRPFDQGFTNFFAAQNPPVQFPDTLWFSDIYDTTVAGATTSIQNIYYLNVTASGAQSSRFELGFNIVEGSVQVLFNGVPMTPNVDYTVDYIVGEVVIRNPAALVPGANVQVKYEQNDLFEIASKTLSGARAELNLFPNTNLGFTIMNLNQATLSTKVRLDEEPTNNTIMGTDLSTGFNLPFLTDVIDLLPNLKSKEMSSVKISGEAAYMMPNANTMTSSIPGDQNQSVAYVDDFEGALRTIPLPVTYVGWTLASAPIDPTLPEPLADSSRNWTKARMSWYNVLPTNVTTQDIWPLRQTRAGQNNVTVLNLDFDPNHRGVYNFSPNLDATLHRQKISTNTGKFDDPELRKKNWNGIMRYIGASAGSLFDQNITAIQLWIKAEPTDNTDLASGRLYIDLGTVSEAVIPFPPGNLYSEDRVNGNPNGVLNDGEDVGLDMLTDAQEQVTYRSFLDANASDPDVNRNDPSGDDYQPYGDGSNLVNFNGTENNKPDPAGLLPNTEDLNANGQLDAVDEYAEYDLRLDTLNNPLHIGGQNGWYQYQIPLLQASRLMPGDQSIQQILQNVQYIRLWVSGFASPVRIRIAEMDIIGNQWIQQIPNDTLMKISVVNIEDNPDYAAQWNQMGIVRELDRTDPSQVIAGNEQSLSLVLNGLGPDSSRQAVKFFDVRPLDLFNYKIMKMFVHGDPTMTYTSQNHDAELFMRFGTDSLNYYEYREPIHQGWDVAMNNIAIDFSQVTAMKSSRDSANQYVTRPVANGPPGSFYAVRGNPDLRSVRQISIGVKNSGKSGGLYGQVWVNELRLVGVDNTSGLAYHFDTQIKLADFASVAMNYSNTDPYFHALDQRFGSYASNINWSINTSASLDKFFPPEWQGTSIPVAYSHSEQIVKPKYMPNSDIVVTEAAALASDRVAKDSGATAKQIAAAADSVVTQSQTLHVQNSYSLSNFRIAFPTQLWYIRDTFSKLTYSFTYNNERDRDPTIAERYSWAWNLGINYSVSLPSDYYVQPFSNLFRGVFLLDDFKDWKLYFSPIQNFSGRAGGQRSRTYQLSQGVGINPQDSRNFTAQKSIGFGWKLTEGGLLNLSGDYGLSINRNLLPLDDDSLRGRSFSQLVKNLFFGGQDGSYSQRVSLNMKPKILNIFDIPKYLDMNGPTYAVNYNWQNTFQNGDLGKSASWDNNISLGFAFRLKSLVDPLFESNDMPSTQQPNIPPPKKLSDSTGKILPDTTQGSKKSAGKGFADLLPQLKSLARVLIKIPFLDYENINISFTQTNRSGNAGVLGATGFQNFWGRSPFEGSLEQNGPSRLYQLGLISDPSGTLKFSPSSSFPFLGWTTIPGRRAPNGLFADQFGESNTLSLRTTRPLWTGASLEINWKVGWQFSKTTSIQTDSLGFALPPTSDPQTTGSIERSFLSLPPVLFFKVFKSNLEDVGKKFDEARLNLPDAQVNAALAQSFEKGLEALPILDIFGQYMPRANWSLRWDGIEKVLGISGVVDHLSFEHSYSSSFRRDYQTYPGNGEQTNTEQVSYAFSPLAGITASFKDFLKGTMSGTFRYNTSTNYDLNLAALPANIVETLSQEISLSLTYSRKGFSFPLFGLNLSNDVDFTFTFSLTKNARTEYDPTLLSSNQDGSPLDGSTQTNMEPQIRYVLSTRVTASIYYKYSKTAPDASGSLIYGTTSNEAGVNVHISI